MHAWQSSQRCLLLREDVADVLMIAAVHLYIGVSSSAFLPDDSAIGSCSYIYAEEFRYSVGGSTSIFRDDAINCPSYVYSFTLAE